MPYVNLHQLRRSVHEGLTCERYRSAIKADAAFEDWKLSAGAKDCSKCGATIQKIEGCNHMVCSSCGAHICWICLKVFGSGAQAYDHLNAEHGGFYDDGYGGDDDAGHGGDDEQ